MCTVSKDNYLQKENPLFDHDQQTAGFDEDTILILT